MKFDVVIGNPPYQENDNGKRDDGAANASASPIYHLFVNQAEKISEIQSLIIPARWTSGAGKGLGTFSKELISRNDFLSFDLFVNSRDVFPNNDIKGGVCFFVRSNSHIGKSTVRIHKSKSDVVTSLRFLDENNINIFIPYSELSSILDRIIKIEDLENNNIQQIVSVLKPYGLRTDFFRNPEKYNLPDIQDKRIKNDDLEIIGLENGKRVSKFVDKNYPIQEGLERIYKFKVIFPYAYGSGEFGERTPNSIIGQPGQINTETFLNIGSFDSRSEAENLRKYINTKFFRSLVGILKVTQHSTRTFSLVPLQDFTSNSIINWSKSMQDIDQQLYKKYSLSVEEINFIEINVKEMK